MNNLRFESKEDYKEALIGLCRPLGKYYSEGKALLSVGHTAAHYGDRIIGLEGFSRLLWGIVPCWAGGGTTPLDDVILTGLRNGTDPENEEYWGKYGDGSQAYVEMAAVGLALLLTPEKVWEPLTCGERRRLTEWLLQINEHSVSDNNWLFFRVLVNCGLKKAGGEYDQAEIGKALDRVDTFYLDGGWYSDGATMQRDYYIPFAMHFYSLIYAGVMGVEDPVRAAVYKERALLFARDFIGYFGTRGEALPYGRSLTYRFAQGAFWAALAFAGVEAGSWGIMKGVLNRHLRYWFSQPILDHDDVLTIGYAYPNLHMAEGYNAPGSPYWALKSFLVLALPETHPFWQAQELDLPAQEGVRTLKHPMLLMKRSDKGYVTALASGQFSAWEPVHAAEKYEKFAYSSYFGFHVPRSPWTMQQAAPDNMLGFWKYGCYHVRRRCESVTVEEGRLVSVWSPFAGITVETQLSFRKDDLFRRHVIDADCCCLAAEAGFALPYSGEEELTYCVTQEVSRVEGRMGMCAITVLMGRGEPKILQCEANTNLLYPRTILPYMEFEIKKGRTVLEVLVEGREGR